MIINMKSLQTVWLIPFYYIVLKSSNKNYFISHLFFLLICRFSPFVLSVIAIPIKIQKNQFIKLCFFLSISFVYWFCVMAFFFFKKWLLRRFYAILWMQLISIIDTTPLYLRVIYVHSFWSKSYVTINIKKKLSGTNG